MSEIVFDIVYGVHTRGIVRHEKIGPYEHAIRYEPSRRSWVKRTLTTLPGRPADFTFVDIGCGRGLVLLLAAQREYRRVIGIERSPDLCAHAQKNARAFRGRHVRPGQIECICADATTWELPVEPLVVYFYNAFRGPALEAFAANVGKSLREHRRELMLVYVFPEFRETLDAIPEIEALTEERRYVVYRAVNPRAPASTADCA